MGRSRPVCVRRSANHCAASSLHAWWSSDAARPYGGGHVSWQTLRCVRMNVNDRKGERFRKGAGLRRDHCRRLSLGCVARHTRAECEAAAALYVRLSNCAAHGTTTLRDWWAAATVGQRTLAAAHFDAGQHLQEKGWARTVPVFGPPRAQRCRRFSLRGSRRAADCRRGRRDAPGGCPNRRVRQRGTSRRGRRVW